MKSFCFKKKVSRNLLIGSGNLIFFRLKIALKKP